MTQQDARDAERLHGPPPAGALLVDLESLVRTDLTIESLFAAFGSHPFAALACCVSYAFDRSALRDGIANLADLDPSALPYDQDALARIAQARRDGCSVHLAEGGRLAQKVARHLGLDEHAPEASAERLVLPRRSYRLARIVDSIRVEQWSKNLLVFVPILTALKLDMASFGAAGALFVAFSLCASAGYVFNDLVDLRADRLHPEKRRRPFAAADVPLSVGLGLIPVLLIAAFAVAFFISFEIAFILAVYLAATAAYSLVLKRKLLLDVIAIGSLYTLRVYAGAVAIGVPLSGWLLLFCIFIFVALALVKRCSEMTLRAAAGLSDPSNRDYKASDLPALFSVTAAAAFSAVVIFALYVESDAVRAIYTHPERLLFAVPVLIYWLARMMMLAHRGLIVGDPVVFALRDRASWACAVVMVAIMATAI